MRISIIGSGNIGGAIARGLAKGTMFKASGYHLYRPIGRDLGEDEKDRSGLYLDP